MHFCEEILQQGNDYMMMQSINRYGSLDISQNESTKADKNSKNTPLLLEKSTNLRSITSNLPINTTKKELEDLYDEIEQIEHKNKKLEEELEKQKVAKHSASE